LIRERRNPVAASAYLIGARVAANAVSWLGTLLVVRALSQADWGAYTLIIGLTSILDVLVNFQLSRLIVVELVRGDRDAGETMGSFLTLRLGLATAGYGIALVIAAVGPYPSSLLPAMAVGGLNLVFGSLLDGLLIHEQTRLRLRPFAALLVVSRIVFFGLVVALFVVGDTRLLAYVLATLVGTVLPFVGLAVVVRRTLPLRPAIEPSRWWAWLADSLPIALGFAIGTLYFRIDVVLLSLLDSVRSVGLYGVGYKIGDLLDSVSTGLFGTAFVLFVRGWPTHAALFWKNWRGAFALSTIIAVGAATGFSVFAHPAVVTLFGSDYAPATGAARVVVIGCALHFFTALLVTTLVVVGRTRAFIRAGLLGLAANVVINLAVIPRYSYSGAAWVTLATEGLVVAVLARAVSQIPGFSPPPRRALVSSLLAGVALVVIGLALGTFLPWAAAAAFAAVAFCIVLHAVGVDGRGGLRVVPQLLSDEGLPLADARAPIPPVAT
jgi:O-antigen/teichoic acid export membrane protein